MRFVIFVGFYLSLMSLVCSAQPQISIREKITPLRSTRSDVEKIARYVSGSGDSVKYETDSATVRIFYSRGVCVVSGWNVPADRVVSFLYYPHSELFLDDKFMSSEGLVMTGTDTGHTILTNRAEGVEYLIEEPSKRVESINFTPVPSDFRLRCKGFPEYDPVVDNYSPYQIAETESVKDWDNNGIFATLARVRERENDRGFIFVYWKQGEQKSAEHLRKKISVFVKTFLKSKSEFVSVELGGIRNGFEVESFIVPNSYPRPTARPYFPKP